MAAVALLAITGAGFAYLHSTAELSPGGSGETPVTTTYASRDPVNFVFASPSSGWAVINPTGPAEWPAGYFVFHTADGGNHWTEQLRGSSKSPGFMPMSIDFVTTSVAYLTVSLAADGEDMYRSDDAGLTWQVLTLPGRPTDAVGVGEDGYLWALTPGATAGRGLRLYESRDAGVTWRRMPDPPADATSIAIRDRYEAWLGSADVTAPHVYYSEDDGQKWVRQDLPAAPDAPWAMGTYQTRVDLLPIVGAVARSSAGYTGDAQAFLFTSFTFGDTWTQVPVPPGHVAYQNAINWWAMQDGVLWKSTDAGQEWLEFANGLPQWQYTPHVIDPSHAWAELIVVGGFGLALTSDGGMHWTRSAIPQPR